MLPKVVFLGLVWPEPETTAAGSRILQLIRFFCDDAAELHFASTALPGDHSYPLEDLGVQTHSIALNDSGFDRWIAAIDPEIVVFDRFVTEEQFSWRVRESCPSALRILDTEDLHFLRESRRLSLLDKEKGHDPEPFTDIALRELGSIYRSDLSLIISETEMDLLTGTFKVPPALLHYLPFLISTGNLPESRSLPSFSERVDFMTIGNWKHGPNKDSVYYLKKEIWPLIRKQLPDTRVHVYGAYGPGEKSDLHDPKTGFLIKGWKESKAEAFTSHRVCLAPLRYGAGLKGKLFDALCFGTPSVTTSVGIEGITATVLDVNSDASVWNGFVSDIPEKFAEAAVTLYTDEKIWYEAQSRGNRILRARFLKESFFPELASRIKELRDNLNTHRRSNLPGALLWHHSAQSTKYLSKWIEAKNKNSK